MLCCEALKKQAISAPHVLAKFVKEGAECYLLRKYQLTSAMKTTALSVLLACMFLGDVDAADPATALDQQVAAVIKEIQAQQATIAENQAKIDAKLVTVSEAVRIARIYSSRGGH